MSTLNTSSERTLEERFLGKSDDDLEQMRAEAYAELGDFRTEDKMKAPIERHIERLEAEIARRTATRAHG